ncbi:MAG TPA: hypothetical protein VF720_12955 [Candidatus Eisenbacteria bacterium]
MRIPRTNLDFVRPAILLALLGMATLVNAAPLGRSFTYQGKLSQAGTPVTGAVTLRFSLWDAAGTGDPPTGGVIVGAFQILPDVAVTEGLFTVVLNSGGEFGATAFNGQERWLQAEVCEDGTCAETTVLGPRQSMTGAPYALGPWQLSGSHISYTNGNVGIGTSTPAVPLHIMTPDEGLRIQGTSGTAWASFYNAAGTALGYVGDGSGSDANIYLASYGNDVILYTSTAALTAKANGNIGIGTSAPAEKLEVRGNIKLGTSGTLFAPSATENLRMLRGRVSSAGAVLTGTGFTSSRTNVGIYNIAFSSTFPVAPVLVAAAEAVGTPYYATVSFTTTTQAAVRTFNASGAPADIGFSFMIAGTR